MLDAARLLRYDYLFRLIFRHYVITFAMLIFAA